MGEGGRWMTYAGMAHMFRTIKALEDAHAMLGEQLTREHERAEAEATDRRAAEGRAHRAEDRADTLRARLDEAQAAAMAERERADALARAVAERASWSRWRRLREALRR
jgi:hypothetical protein